MINAWNELINMTDTLYRSQLDGITMDKLDAVIKKAQNNEHELLQHALLMILELRNHARNRVA